MKDSINEYKSNGFPGGLWQEMKSVHAKKVELPVAKEKISLSYRETPRVDGPFSLGC